MSITIRGADLNDVPLLGKMNSRLVDDQGTDNTWPLSKYEERFREWLQKGPWQVDVILEKGQIAGYAIYQLRADYFYPEQPVIFVRQFYIEREHRRRGLGRAAFQDLIDKRFPEGYDAIALDVMAANTGGQQFWTKLGFATYFVAMKRDVSP